MPFPCASLDSSVRHGMIPQNLALSLNDAQLSKVPASGHGNRDREEETASPEYILVCQPLQRFGKPSGKVWCVPVGHGSTAAAENSQLILRLPAPSSVGTRHSFRRTQGATAGADWGKSVRPLKESEIFHWGQYLRFLDFRVSLLASHLPGQDAIQQIGRSGYG